MFTSHYTPKFLTKNEIPMMRNYAKANEERGALHPDILEVIHQKKWLRTTIPESISGGFEWSVPEIIALFEELAYVDGNIGWTVNLGAGANLFAGFFPEAVANEIFSDPLVCCAGSGASTGTALYDEENENYALKGYWRYASGSDHATHFTGHAALMDTDGNEIKNRYGELDTVTFLVPKSDVISHPSWRTLGLTATSSHDFEIKGATLPAAHTFDISKGSDFQTGALYHYPFPLFSTTALSVMVSGITLHFIELFESEILTKIPLYGEETLEHHANVRQDFERLVPQFFKLRSDFYAALEASWGAVSKEKMILPQLENLLTDSALAMSDFCYDLATTLFRYCGMSILFEGSEFNQVYRDLMTATQHFVISPINRN